MKDGKIRVARRGNFPEPLSKDVMVVEEGTDAFLVGPYPDKNVMILPFDRYHKMMYELKNHCPNAQNWKITALVFIAMFITLFFIHLHQWAFSRDMYSHLRRLWRTSALMIKNNEKKKN